MHMLFLLIPHFIFFWWLSHHSFQLRLGSIHLDMWPWYDVCVAMSEISLEPPTKGLGIDDPEPLGLKVWEFETLLGLDELVSSISCIHIRNYLG